MSDPQPGRPYVAPTPAVALPTSPATYPQQDIAQVLEDRDAQIRSRRRTNGLAAASLLASLMGFFPLWVVGSLFAVIVGHIARKQAAQNGAESRALAMAGIVLGYIGLGAAAIVAVIALVALVAPSTS
jgi:Domain of unknown function (DUF4190)